LNLKKYQGQLIAIAGVVAIGIIVATMPIKSSEVPVIDEVAETNDLEGVDSKIKTAVEIITSGKGAPMKGIGLLKEVLEEDENNTEALYYLGVFSIQSGQFDKGIGRFESILELEPNNQEARLLLSRCLIGNNQPEKARIELDKIMQSEASKELKDGANELIEEIKKS
jgi:tetratricopeptide (TPR) repeat protein